MADDVVVTRRGPMFNHAWPGVFGRIATEARDSLTHHGAELVKLKLSSVLKHPTGYYVSRVTTDIDLITDGGVVYGPWLEGVGSRNAATRFKGYHTFRETTQLLNKKAPNLVNEIISRHIKELG